MRPYLLRHPGGLLLVGVAAVADIAWHLLDVGEWVLDFIDKGRRT